MYGVPVSETDLKHAIYSMEIIKKSIEPISGFHLEKLAKSQKKTKNPQKKNQYFEKTIKKHWTNDPNFV